MVIRMEPEPYAELCKEFLKVAKLRLSSTALSELKNFYARAINSVRASSYINSIEQLINILEKRGVIRYDRIIPLRHIAVTYLGNSVVNDILDDYESWLVNYNPPYLPHNNLYRLTNGECYLRKKNINDCSSHYNTHSISITQDVFIGKDFNSTNAPKISISTSGAKISINNDRNFNNNDNNQLTERCKDCHIHISHEICNVAQTKEVNVVSKVQIPLNVNSESCALLNSTTEDLDNNDSLTVPNRLSLSAPQSIEPQTICSHNLLNRSRSKENIKIHRNGATKLSQKKYIGSFLIILAFALILVTLTVVPDLSKTSVYNNSKPTAPSPVEVGYLDEPSTSNNSYSGYTTPWTRDPYNELLQKLPKKERELQERVFRAVSRDLGISWRDVARRLKVRDSDIDDIESRYSDFSQKAYEALKKFATLSDPGRWQLNLKRGLEAGRRKDLADMVDELSYWTELC